MVPADYLTAARAARAADAGTDVARHCHEGRVNPRRRRSSWVARRQSSDQRASWLRRALRGGVRCGRTWPARRRQPAICERIKTQHTQIKPANGISLMATTHATCWNEYFTHAHIYARTGILTRAPSTLADDSVKLEAVIATRMGKGDRAQITI